MKTTPSETAPTIAPETNGTSARSPHSRSTQRATWVKIRSEVAVEWKRAIARYVATHLIDYGSVVQLGPGTTFSQVMKEIVSHQVSTRKSQDLVISTTNLEVMGNGREGKAEHPQYLQSMQIILTGGAYHEALNALVGPYAVEGIKTEKIRPDVVFFGAKGLSFHDGLSLRYQFDDELSTQEAFATRPTDKRVLLCDHTKLACECGWKASITFQSTLANTDQFIVVTTYPTDDEEARNRVEQQETAFGLVLKELAVDKAYAKKEVVLRLLNEDGEVVRDISLSDRRNAIDQESRGSGRSSRAHVAPSQTNLRE